MDCKNVQSVIDTDLRRESANEQIRAHLSCCQDCHRYSTENSALLALLGAQPVIEAPADFDFKLRARLARGTYTQEQENTALVALLSAQPAIDAPADFDFKLRARLARAKSEPAAPEGILDGISSKLKLRPFAFTLGRTVAATTTLAAVVAISALHFANGDHGYQSAKLTDANNNITEKLVTAPTESGVPRSGRASSDMNPTAVLDKPSFSGKNRYRNQTFTSTSVARVRTLPDEIEVEQPVKNDALEDMWRGFDPEKREIITASNRDLIGAENSASTIPKTPSFVPSI
jgi:hypothetical protein